MSFHRYRSLDAPLSTNTSMGPNAVSFDACANCAGSRTNRRMKL